MSSRIRISQRMASENLSKLYRFLEQHPEVKQYPHTDQLVQACNCGHVSPEYLRLRSKSAFKKLQEMKKV